MSFTFINNIAGSGTGTFTTSPGIDTTGADLLIAVVADYQLGTTTISDNKGNSGWTGLTAKERAGDMRSQIWYFKNPAVGSGHTFTATATGSIYCRMFVIAFSGAHLSAPYDSPNENGTTGTGVTTLQIGSITPSQDACLIIAGLANSANSTYSIDESMSITDQGPYGAVYGGAAAYKIQTTATAINPTWSGLGSGAAAVTIASFKIASGTISINASGAEVALGRGFASVLLPLTVVDYSTPNVAMDNPAEASSKSGSFTVDGWTFDNFSVTSVEVFVDGVSAGLATYGSARGDVAAVWPNCPTAIGYTKTLNTASYSVGARVITVRVTDSNGNIAIHPDRHVTFT